MPCLLISLHKQGKFNIRYIIGRKFTLISLANLS